jgi:hypothetical protein
MTERIDLPSNARLNADLSLQKLLAEHHVVNHVLIVSASLIMHGPTSIDEFEASLLGKHTYGRLDLFGLLDPPHLEELHLDLCIPTVGVP